MNRLKYLSLLVTMAAIGCGPIAVQPPSPPPSRPAPWAVDVIACAHRIDPCVGIPGATIGLHVRQGDADAAYDWQTANEDGYAVWVVPPALVASDAIVRAPGYVEARAHIDVVHSHDGQQHNLVAVEGAHVDPSTIPFEALEAVRGAMWPVAEFPGLPYGPRPGDPTNIIATGSWHCYDPAQRDAIAAELHRRGYTHVAYGPIGLPANGSYHGQYCDTPNDFATWFDDLQELWDRGFIPIVFIKPDNWTFDQTYAYFDPVFRTPRAQKLLRILVPAGWEPTLYGWSSKTWALYFAWARERFPDAVLLLHNVAKPDGSAPDAPIGTDALYNDDGQPDTSGMGWQRVFDAGADGWLIQTGPFTTPMAAAPNLREWCAMFAPDGDGAAFHSIAWHFANGISHWPTWTKRGRKFLLFAGEYAALAKYHGDLTEDDAEDYGDKAVACGADGYFDSGRLAVRRSQ